MGFTLSLDKEKKEKSGVSECFIYYLIKTYEGVILKVRIILLFSN